MELRPEFQIMTVIKALADVVLPAVDPENRLAQEQGNLAVSVLRMAAHNLPVMYDYDRIELTELVGLANELCRIADSRSRTLQASEKLKADLAAGMTLVQQAGAAPADTQAAIFSLRASTGSFVAEGYRELDSGLALALAHAVTAHAEQQLLRERALLIDQGWEAKPDRIPAIEALVASNQNEDAR